MAANIQDVKKLRDKTGAGFADCKKALEETNNDFDAALKRLKEMGMAAAAKRSGRATGEGSLFVEARGNKAILLELLCETDFVARNEEFQALGKSLINDMFENNLLEKNDAMQTKVQALIGTIKENMEICRIEVIQKNDDEIFATYTHGLPARLGTVVVVKSSATTGSEEADAIQKFAFNCALHSVAKTPLFLDEKSISEDYKKEQMDIINTQVAQLDKPPQVADGIATGKWKKHTTEICFMLQSWVHDEKSSTENEIKALAKSTGADISISKFVVFVLGS